MMKNTTGWVAILVTLCFCSQSCYRNAIGFGNLPDNNYTNVVYTDTVAPALATVILDSFSTGDAASFLLGKYRDPYLGIVSARPYFQMTIPNPAVTIPVTAQYDSFDLVIHPNKYYYGDTSRLQTVTVDELAEPITYTYNNSLFNTSSFAVKPFNLGVHSLGIRPSVDDSILIRLDDAKGLELFTKLADQASEILRDDNFQDYFKGISLSVGASDTAAVYGLSSAANGIAMRVFYHTTTPYLQNLWVDFPLKATTYSFNQILTDRSGTPLYSATPGLKEIPSELTGGVGFTQYGAGVLLKITFPSLRGILSSDKIIELQKAELIVRPLASSYDLNKFKLPGNVSLLLTDATNGIGSPFGTSVPPVTDEIYGTGSYYRFDVTPFINALLTTPGSQDKGFFVVQNTSSPNVTRAVMGDSRQPVYNSELLVTAVVINK